MAEALQETIADRRIVLEYAIEQAIQKSVAAFTRKSADQLRNLRYLEATAAAARLQRAGDSPSLWWPSTVAYAPPSFGPPGAAMLPAVTAALERADAVLEMDLRKLNADLALYTSIGVLQEGCESGGANRSVAVASRPPGMSGAIKRRQILCQGVLKIMQKESELNRHIYELPHSTNAGAQKIRGYQNITQATITILDKKPRTFWTESENESCTALGAAPAAARPDKEAERARMNAQLLGDVLADQPPGYTE